MKQIHVPSSKLWRPDIVLVNSADGSYDLYSSSSSSSSIAKVSVYHTGHVSWSPSAILRSSCVIDLEFLPFDEQECAMKFASLIYDGEQVDVAHAENQPGTDVVGERLLSVWTTRLSISCYVTCVSGPFVKYIYCTDILKC